MQEVTRRRLLGYAAAGAGSAVASSFLPKSLARAAGLGPQQGSLKDVEHVVIHMQENRSFDHYFGTLPGVRGFGDPNALTLSTGKSVFYQPTTSNPDGYLLPWHLDTQNTSAQAIPSTSHAWAVQHQAWNNGKMDSWLPAHIGADGATNGPFTMGYYERDDIPFHFALAENFTICDGYHCSLLGPTWPNRLYLMTGMIDPSGSSGGPIISNTVTEPYTWTTYPERLTQAGISWRIYQEEDDYGTNVLEFFKQYQDASPGSPLYENALTIYPPDRFEWDARNGKLPTVSWIVPTSGQSEHPAYIPAAGADYLSSKLEAVASNRDLWSKTVFIVNYDENDGLFDHVPPPTPPAGTPGEFVDGLPIGGGIRVPCIIVSPWTVGGWVASENFDHTSVLQLLEQFTGVQEPNITDWRRQTFGDLTSALGFSRGRARSVPPLPATAGAFWQAEKELQSNPVPVPPGANQTPPVQPTKPGKPGKPYGFPTPPYQANTAAVNAGNGATAFRGTSSRLQESLTTHRSDFPRGMGGMSFPGKLASVEGKEVASAATHAYVAGVCAGSIALIDTTSYALASAITSQTNPYGLAVTPDGSKIYVTESGANSVAAVSTATNKVTKTIVAGVYPHGVAVTPDGKHALVANTGPDTGPEGADTISVIDTATDAVTGTYTVGQAPQKIAVSPDGSQAWVTCYQGVYVIQLASGRVRPILDGLVQAHGLAFTADGRQAWVAVSQQNQVAVIDTRSGAVVRRIGVGQTPWSVAFSSDGGTAYVTNANDNTVSVISTKSYRAGTPITAGQIPTGIATYNGTVWVANNVSSTISVIDTAKNQVIETIDLGISAEPTEIVFA